LPLQSYRERSRPSRTRKAKNPNKIHVSDWYFPGSIVCQAAIANNPNTTSAMTILPLPAGLRSTSLTSSCNFDNEPCKSVVHRGGFEPP
jgi:hypothetical protein